jgi:hypothetical protein
MTPMQRFPHPGIADCEHGGSLVTMKCLCCLKQSDSLEIKSPSEEIFSGLQSVSSIEQ